MKKIFILIAPVIAVLLFAVFLVPGKNEIPKAGLPRSPSPSEVDYPFEELTVPYMRKIEYDGRFFKRELISENSEYSSYYAGHDSEGIKIYGLLTVPKGSVPPGGWKALVFVHGYIPPAQYRTTSNYESYVEYFASNGFVVFKTDLRGHAESEGTPGGAYYSSGYVIDVLNAYNALSHLEFVDPKKIGLWGHSMAGNVVMRSLAVKKNIPAAVIWAGAVYSYEDFSRYGLSDSSYVPPSGDSPRASRRREIASRYGEPGSGHKFWEELAPISFIDDIGTLIQVHHAADDRVVNIGYSRDLVAAMEKKGREISYYEYPSGGHNITGESFGIAMSRSVDFFESALE